MGAAKNARKARRKANRSADRRSYIFDFETLPSFRPGGKLADWTPRATVVYFDTRKGRVEGPKVIDLNREELSKLWQAEGKSPKLYDPAEHDPNQKQRDLGAFTDQIADASLLSYSIPDVWKERLAELVKNKSSFRDLYQSHFPPINRHRSIGAPATNSIRGLDFDYALIDDVFVRDAYQRTNTGRTSRATETLEARKELEDLFNIDFSKIEQRVLAHFVDRFSYGPERRRLEQICKKALYLYHYGVDRWQIMDLFKSNYDEQHMAVIRNFVYRGVRIGDII